MFAWETVPTCNGDPICDLLWQNREQVSRDKWLIWHLVHINTAGYLWSVIIIYCNTFNLSRHSTIRTYNWTPFLTWMALKFISHIDSSYIVHCTCKSDASAFDLFPVSPEQFTYMIHADIYKLLLYTSQHLAEIVNCFFNDWILSDVTLWGIHPLKRVVVSKISYHRVVPAWFGNNAECFPLEF